jgi:hypothetical protein
MEAPAPVEISFEDGITESLLMTALGQEVYRAEESSMLGVVTYKDVFEARRLSDGSLRFLRIVTPSGLKTKSWILPIDTIESKGFRAILDSVMELGGCWEQAFGGVLLVHLPPEAADAVEARINEFRQS